MSKQQRRKGNAKTASSAQAADLLGQAVPFIGFDGGFTNVFESVESDFSNDLSSEVIIILKKLSKKDPQTREKALRELIEIVSSKSVDEMDGIFNYYVTVFDKLSVDGSPTVRVLALKCLAIFITSLKKSAEKHLRKLIPFVLICSCDISNVVSGQSEDLLSSCFPQGKAAKVVQIFSGDAANVCREMISQIHPLFPAQKYDNEEDPIQRDSRLTSQSLQLLSKLAEDRSDAVISAARQLVDEPVLVRKLLKSSPAVQSALLGLAQKLPDASTALVDSPISHFALNNLDNTEPLIGSASFNVFLLLAQENGFYAKYDVKKTVISKVQFIVRKKIGHWRYCGPFLLPAMAAIYEHLDSADATAFALSYLESFADNMPFESAAVSPSAWSIAFSECLKYFLTKTSASEDLKAQENVVQTIVKVVDLVETMPEEVHTNVADLLLWICEKKALTEPVVRMLVNNIQLNLLNKRPKTDALIVRLLSPCHMDFVFFHVDMLRGSDCPNSFISVLENASDEYLKRINKDVDVYSMIGKNERVFDPIDLKRCARIVFRLMDTVPEDKIQISNPQLAQSVFIESVASSSENWQFLGRAVCGDDDFTEFITKCLREWAVKPISAERPFIAALKRLKESERSEVIQAILNSCDHRAVEFIVKCSEEFEFPSCEKESLSSWLLLQYMNPVVDKSASVILDSLKKNPPSAKSVRYLVPFIFGGKTEDAPFSKFRNTDKADLREHISTISQRGQTLLTEDPELYSSLFISQEDLAESVRRWDDMFAAREIVSLLPILSSSALTKRDASHFVQEISDVAHPLLSFYSDLITDCDSPNILEQTSAYALLVHAAIHLCAEAELPDNLELVENVAKKILYQGDNLYNAAIGLQFYPGVKDSFLIHYALRLAVTENTDRGLGQGTSVEESELPLCWAMKFDTSKRRGTTVERWISKFHCEDTALDFLDHLREHVSANGDDWESVIFNAKSSDSGMWQLNVFCLQAAREVMQNYPEGISPELLDFIMCGLISAFDTSVEMVNTSGSFPIDVQFEAFLGNALRLCLTCFELNDKLKTEAEETPDFCNDWENFFRPMLSAIVLRLWSALPIEAPETLSTRFLCKVVQKLVSLPDDLGLPQTFTPEMDNLKYDPVLQTLITRTVAALKTGNGIRGFSALHVLRLVAPVMYRQENGEWSEEEKVSEKGPKKMVVPYLIKELIMEGTGFPMFAAMDATVHVLKNYISSDEERLLFCDAFPLLVDRVLPPLISSCPQTLSEALKLTFFTDDSILLDDLKQIETLQIRYPCGLLYRIVAAVPAVVRTWFNGLPTAASVIVDRYISEMVTRHIVNNELNKVKEANRDLKLEGGDQSLKIRVIPVCRQIVAEYTVEETTMRLSIEMPENYPLAVPEISLDKAIVANDRAKKWLLQLTAYLYHQNGAAVDGIRMWRKNVDRDVEGAEACTICMMTIHSNSHQLPKVKCKQCKNKFHSNCLYKWFDSSHQTSCPLCRTNFT